MRGLKKPKPGAPPRKKKVVRNIAGYMDGFFQQRNTEA